MAKVQEPRFTLGMKTRHITTPEGKRATEQVNIILIGYKDGLKKPYWLYTIVNMGQIAQITEKNLRRFFKKPTLPLTDLAHHKEVSTVKS